jgi:dTDP-L-rhamnose 4-epimerase
VRILDNLHPLAHPNGPPKHLPAEAELRVGDLRDPDAVGRALDGVSVVYHLGGMVGNGQSMHDLRLYVDANCVGTATLLEQMVLRRSAIRRLVVASSMVVYGDGAYACPEHGRDTRAVRTEQRLKESCWEPICQQCGREVEPIAIDEQRPLEPNSVYGVSKRDQEELCLVTGRTYAVPTIALRYLCAYGSRQALGNPYTGVAAIWASRLLNGRAPLVFEDGRQVRDFVHVSDVAAATLAAAEAPASADYGAYNVGSGQRYTIADLAQSLCRTLGQGSSPEFSGEYRMGDIRHCFADISRAKSALGWSPTMTLADGLEEFVAWATEQRPDDKSEGAMRELRQRGLIR